MDTKKITVVLMVVMTLFSLLLVVAVVSAPLPFLPEADETQKIQAVTQPVHDFKQDAVAGIEAAGYEAVSLGDFSLAGCIHGDSFGIEFSAVDGNQLIIGFICQNADTWLVRSVTPQQ